MFVNDKKAHVEEKQPYFVLQNNQGICRKILDEFDLDPQSGHIINGHVPVKMGENPVKGEGLLFMIDGGISKAYQPKTGIGGYTFIFSSRYMAFAKHSPEEWKNNIELPTISEVELMKHRVLIEETDNGAEIKDKVNALEALLEAYRSGQIKERR